MGLAKGLLTKNLVVNYQTTKERKPDQSKTFQTKQSYLKTIGYQQMKQRLASVYMVLERVQKDY